VTGALDLKNIARPVEAFVLRVTATTSTLQSEKPLVLDGGQALPGKPSIAVLPFANMSSDPEQEYFSDGLADDIITILSRIQSLFVIARSSSFTYRGHAVDVRQVSRELGVRYALEGSVRRSGDRIRVTAQLIEAETGNHIWAERYDRHLTEVFAVQDEITAEVTAAILPALTDAEQRRALRKPPQSLGAWEAYPPLFNCSTCPPVGAVEGQGVQDCTLVAARLNSLEDKQGILKHTRHVTACRKIWSISWVTDPAS
jgi:adenylate cyclase